MNAALGGAIAPGRPEGRRANQRLSRRVAAGAERALQRANARVTARYARQPDRGFTLLELIVALTIGAMVVLMAHRVLRGVIDGAEALQAARNALDHEANGRRMLTSLFGSLDVTADSVEFRGEPTRVAFTTWHRDGHGFRTRSQVTLMSQDSSLVALGVHQEPLAVLPAVVTLEVDYLLEYGAQERWVRAWISPASAPAAVRLRLARGTHVDTVLLVIGGRG